MIIVITCTGREELLAQTLESLRLADLWPGLVCMDLHLQGSRWNTLRAFWAFLETDHRRLLLVQDDVLVRPAITQMVARDIPADVAVVTFHDCAMDFPFGAEDGEYLLPVGNLEGGQCLLFPRESVEFLMRQDPGTDPYNEDLWMGGCLARSSRPNKLVVRRGLVEHVGRVSICHPGRLNFPRADQTVHDLPCVGAAAAEEAPPCPDSAQKSGGQTPGAADTSTTRL